MFDSACAPAPARRVLGISLWAVLALTAGTIFVMWIGEQITEYGVGNGISLIIMAGIIARDARTSMIRLLNAESSSLLVTLSCSS